MGRTRGHMCISAWYQGPSGEKIEESYCGRTCEAQPCPTNFACEDVGTPPLKVCIPQPHGVCALLAP